MGAGLIASQSIIRMSNELDADIVNINDITKPEPIIITNPYNFDDFKYNPSIITKRKNNNRKKVKRKKSKNGR